MYTVTMYFCGSGYGDLSAVTIYERIFVMILMALGIMWISVCIAALTSYHNDSSQHNFEYSSYIAIIQDDLAENRSVPPTVIGKILDFYHNLWNYKSGVLRSEFFESLPQAIHIAASTDQYWEMMENSNLLRDLDLPSRRALAATMRTQIYVKGDVILRQGELRTRLMYIIRGIVKVLSSEDTESTIMLLGEGSLICEVSLMLSTPSPVQLEAESQCEVQILDRANLHMTAMTYTQINKVIFENFLEIWNKKISQGERQRRNDPTFSSEFGIQKLPRTNKLRVGFQDEIEHPYTWLHGDEMGHFIYISKKIKKTFNIYHFCKVTTQTSDEICVRTKFPFVFQQGTALLFAWDFIVVIAAISAAVLYPLNAAKEENEFYITLLLINFIYILDLVISIFTATDLHGEPLITIKEILHYRFTHSDTFLVMFIDIVCVVPLSVFYNEDSTATLSLLNLNHLLKIYKVHRFFIQLEDTFLFSIAVVRSTACIVWISILSFWLGFFYFIQACFADNCRDASWFMKQIAKDIEERKNLMRHSYDIQLMMYLGFGFVGNVGISDIQGSTLTEFIIVIVLSVVSVFISSFFIGVYNAVLILARKSEMAFQELVFVTIRFMEYNDFLDSLRTRVVLYLKLQWQYRQGYNILNDKSLFNDTPEHLHNDMLVADRREKLDCIPLFEDTEAILIKYIASHAESYVLPPDEIVVYSGEPCYEFYVVEYGYCEKYSGISRELECVIGPKGNFGVLEMLFGIPSTSELRTTTHVKLLRVTKVLLHDALGHSQLAKKDIVSLINEFKDNDILRKVVPRKKKVYDDKTQKRTVNSWIVFSRNHENYVQPFLNDWTKCAKYILLPRTLNPNGKFLKFWEAFRILTILISALFFPTYSYIWLDISIAKYLRYILDIITLIDMYIMMHVCYYSKDGVLVCHPKATFKNYLSHNFIMDLLVLIPLDYVSEQVVVENRPGFFRPNGISKCIYFQKLISLYRLRSLDEFTEVGTMKSYVKWCHDLIFFSCCIILLNFLASILMIISTDIIFTSEGSEYIIQYPGATWINSKEFNKESVAVVHIMALYWTICMTYCISFGDISPLNSKEMLYCVFIFLIGYALLTYMMVRITSRISGFGVYFTNYQENVNQLIKFLKKKKVSSKLQNEVFLHFEHVWDATYSLDPQAIFNKFHSALQEDTLVFLYEPTFSKCEVFEAMDFSFYRQLGLLVQEEYYREGTFVFEINDIITHIFFIHRGIAVHKDIGNGTKHYLSQGCMFGNIDNSPSIRTSCKVQNITNVVLLKVENRKFYKLIKESPYIEKHIHYRVANYKNFVESQIEVDTKQQIQKYVEKANNKTGGLGTKTTTESFHGKMITALEKRIIPDIIVLSAATSGIIIPYHAAFQNHDLYIFVIEIILTVTFLINLGRNIYLAVVSNKKIKTLATSWDKVKYILKTKIFWIDLFCALPLNLLSLISSQSDKEEIFSYISFSYMIRLYHVVEYFNTASTPQGLATKTIKYSLLEILSTTTLVLHLTACVMYFVDCFKNQCEPNKWAYQPSGDEEPNLVCTSPYVCALYWAVEVYSCTGVGDIVPDTFEDIILLIVLIVFSKFVVCNLVGKLASIAAEHLFTEGCYNYQMSILRTYLKCWNLSAPLVKYVEDYGENLWSFNNGKQIPTFFEKVPAHLKGTMMNEMYGYHLNNNIVFSGSHPAFLRQLTTHFQYTVYFAGNVIVNAGEINGTIYFIDSGEVEVLTVDNLNPTITDVMSSGDAFGMIPGLYKRTPHIQTFRALSGTVILSLQYDQWKYLLPFFPQTHKELYRRACIFSFMP